MKRFMLFSITLLTLTGLLLSTVNVFAVDPSKRPRIYSLLPADMHGPDGLTVSDTTGSLFLTVPNFNGRKDDKGPKLNPGILAKIEKDGTAKKILEFPVLASTGQTGCMGLDFGPDGHLYVADNQYFFDKKSKSRVLRVLMKGDVPTGKVEVVAEGLNLANAALWTDEALFVTDTFLDFPGKFGVGGVWVFPKDKALKAGGSEPTIKVVPVPNAQYLGWTADVKKIDRGDNAGWDGITVAPCGTLYGGNFGDGALYAVRKGEDGKYKVETIHAAGEVIVCCDGVFYDKVTNKIYINDSAKNAIWAFKPTKPGEKAQIELIWENDDTDGADGLLDQPCECVVIDGKMIIVNFDWPFPGLKNQTFQPISTLSYIKLYDVKQPVQKKVRPLQRLRGR
ncbi:MAG: hypothetical protein FWE67_13435 [Planctomycetaceae bacterium]|nr:hypothetical protein [Planctomycetaceae bacterium]